MTRMTHEPDTRSIYTGLSAAFKAAMLKEDDIKQLS